MAGLAFEDKLRLLTALQPEALAALVGAQSAFPEATAFKGVPAVLMTTECDE